MPKAKTPAVKAVDNPQAIAKELVSRLYDDILQEGCAVFLGAGSTTERQMGGSTSFYERIKSISQFPVALPSPSFPDLMQYFCDRIDGGRHNRLIREALSRIEYFCVRGKDNNLANIFTDCLAEFLSLIDS